MGIKQTLGFYQENRQNIIIKFLLFLLSPLFGFIYSLKRINTKSSFVIFFLFSLCFGVCFTPDKNPSNYIDGQSYKEHFLLDTKISSTTYKENWKQYISFETSDKDFYFNTISFLVSRLTDNYHVFFFCIAFVFSFFSLKTFKYLTNEKEFDNSYMTILFCYLFMYIGIFNINGLRFWTGYWVAMYALFKIFRDCNYKYILLIFLAAFCHGTLWLIFPIVLVAMISKRVQYIWIIMYFLSFIVGELSFVLIDNVSGYLPQFLQSLIDSYTSEEYIAERNAEGTGYWIVGEIFKYVVRVFLFITMCIIISNKKIINADNRTNKLFTLLLVLATFSNLMINVPSLGARFSIFTYPLIAYICILHILKNPNYNLFFSLIPLYFFMVIYQQLNQYLSVLNIDFFISSPVYLVVKYLLV